MSVDLKKQLSTYLWVEKFRPTTVINEDGIEVILPKKYKEFFKTIINDGQIPNLLLYSSTPGSGKTTIAKAICYDLDATFRYINVSSQGGIDTLRNDIQKFASMKSLDGKPKIVIMDECLDENEEIRVGNINNYTNLALKDFDLKKMYPIVSFNLETSELENDFGEIVSEKFDDVYEVELENGEKLIVTANHPFIVNNNGKNEEKTINQGLNENDNVVTYLNDLYLVNNSKDIILLKIKKITKLNEQRKVRNLVVYKNHTFISKNGIVTHNCDGATQSLQMGLRAAMEEFKNSCRFILTCNYVSKIIPALKSRCEMFDFNMSDQKIIKEVRPQVISRISAILEAESIEYNQNTIEKLVDNFYPDIRKMISMCQQYSKMNKNIDDNIFNLERIDNEFYTFILEKKFGKARKYLIDKNYNYSELYTDLMENLVPKLESNKQGPVIITLAEYMYRHSFVIDPELNASACLLELMTNI